MTAVSLNVTEVHDYAPTKRVDESVISMAGVILNF
jgi:hypothetical protein